MRHGPSQDNLYVGAGIVMVEPFDANGVGLGLRHLGNVDAFSVTFEVDVLTKYSSMTRVKGLYAEIPRRVRSTFRMQSSEFIDETVRMAFLGTRARLVQAATAVTDEAVTTAITAGEEFIFRTAKLGPDHGRLDEVQRGHRRPRHGLRDLERRRRLDPHQADDDEGWPGAGELHADGVHVDHGPDGDLGGHAADRQGANPLRLGQSAPGPNRMIEVWKTSIRPDGAHDLISDDFGNIVLTGGLRRQSATIRRRPTSTTSGSATRCPNRALT
jgi:hypothetical protein